MSEPIEIRVAREIIPRCQDDLEMVRQFRVQALARFARLSLWEATVDALSGLEKDLVAEIGGMELRIERYEARSE